MPSYKQAFLKGHKIHMNPHTADRQASGTPQTAQPRRGGEVTGQKPHHPPHLKGLISGGVPTETLIVADPRVQPEAGRLWEAKRAPFFSLIPVARDQPRYLQLANALSDAT